MGSRLFREQERCGFDPRGADRSFVQWQGRGPTNRRRGFDSLNSDDVAIFIPRSVAVIRPLKPVMLVRFQLGELRSSEW